MSENPAGTLKNLNSPLISGTRFGLKGNRCGTQCFGLWLCVRRKGVQIVTQPDRPPGKTCHECFQDEQPTEYVNLKMFTQLSKVKQCQQMVSFQILVLLTASPSPGFASKLQCLVWQRCSCQFFKEAVEGQLGSPDSSILVIKMTACTSK